MTRSRLATAALVIAAVIAAVLAGTAANATAGEVNRGWAAPQSIAQ